MDKKQSPTKSGCPLIYVSLKSNDKFPKNGICIDLLKIHPHRPSRRKNYKIKNLIVPEVIVNKQLENDIEKKKSKDQNYITIAPRLIDKCDISAENLAFTLSTLAC